MNKLFTLLSTKSYAQLKITTLQTNEIFGIDCLLRILQPKYKVSFKPHFNLLSCRIFGKLLLSQWGYLLAFQISSGAINKNQLISYQRQQKQEQYREHMSIKQRQASILNNQQIQTEYQNDQYSNLKVFSNLIYNYPLDISLFLIRMFSKSQLYESKFKSSYYQENKCVNISIINNMATICNQFTIYQYEKSWNPKQPSLIVIQYNKELSLSGQIADSGERLYYQQQQQLILVNCIADLKNVVLDNLQNFIKVVEVKLYTKSQQNADIYEMCNLISKCMNLEQFDFLITGRSDGDAIATQIRFYLNHKHLRVLSIEMEYCNLSPVGVHQLCDGLAKCQLIESLSLRLSYNQLNEESARLIGDSVQQLLVLGHLSLHMVKTEIKQGLINLVYPLRKCPKLMSFGFEFILSPQHNFDKREIQIVECFGTQISNCRFLSHLKIDCDFAGLSQLHAALSKSQSLIVVEISMKKSISSCRQNEIVGTKRQLLKSKRLTILKFIC
ncbi:hypothetical protein ABPG72_011058 [Tetrahymena utriculariae]